MLLTWVGALPWSLATAGTLLELHPFEDDGVFPNGLMQAADGDLYGTASHEGSVEKGFFFRVTTSGVLTRLASLDAVPVGKLAQAADGAFYGVTADGGASRQGSVFRITTNGLLTTLHSFDTTNGAWPAAGLLAASDGHLYGTTLLGGAHDLGTLYRLTPEGAFTLMSSFGQAATLGTRPSSSLIETSDGSICGTTRTGGSSGGVIFKIGTDGNYADTNRVNFSGFSTAGAYEGTNGLFYGIAGSTLFRAQFLPWQSTATSIAGVSFEGTNGQYAPVGFIAGTNGSLYGVTTFGGAYDKGTVYRVDLDGAGDPSTLTTLLSFDGTNGSCPETELLLASDGQFYGATSFRPGIPATLFRMTHAGVVTTLHVFTHAGGAHPHAGLVAGTNDHYLGTTYLGGAELGGVAFEIGPTGSFSRRSAFGSATGTRPNGPLVATLDGGYLATTVTGGTNDHGAIVKLTAAGDMTNLVSFGGAIGAAPRGGLAEGTNGHYYGTTPAGGPLSPDLGTIFELTSAGVLTTLISFEGTNGADPWGGLIVASDGHLYGTTKAGGSDDLGTVFRLTHQGTLTTLMSFDGTNNGAHPTARLLQGTNGHLYGTTHNGGAYGFGTVFEMTPAGVLTSLASFNWTNGFGPRAGLIQGANGHFYGTTLGGGDHGQGTLFEVTPAGTITTLLSFDEDLGAEPLSEPVQAGDGTFYVTTSRGGRLGGGNVARISIDDFVITQIIAPGSDVTLTWNTMPGQWYQAQYKPADTASAWQELATFQATNSSASTVDSSPASSNRLYRVVLVP